eukprot:CCRYP_003841-RA/>CCRYP_003841-RA protein AED:0.44 eAED:0.44 QI:39/1/1/1/0/0/3/104/52
MPLITFDVNEAGRGHFKNTRDEHVDFDCTASYPRWWMRTENDMCARKNWRNA